MVKKILLKFIHLVLLTAGIHCLAAENFVIEDIRVEGLQRLTPGTIFNYLPLEVGDTYDDQISLEAVRSLFGTGFFDDVRLERDGNVLVVIVKERPAIGAINITGNKDIKTEDLMKGLDQVGFSAGQVFDQSKLDSLEKELRRQYFSRGKYGVRITSNVSALGNNRVSVAVDISEGRAARIKQINIIGNESYPEDDLLDLFELTEHTLISYFTKTDQYSKTKLTADLESLTSHYLNNGYINFRVDSAPVTITPDKNEIYITINITEGEQYMVNDVKLAGEFLLPEDLLFPFIMVRRGELFSRRNATDTSEALTMRLGHEGYAFANVNYIPDINEEDKTVGLTFFVDPGKRVYVRRVNFTGNTRTRDEVLRREMRQMEGAWISTPSVERGKVRLQRLGYFEEDEINVETPAVPGTVDQVDVNYTVEEKPFGNFMAGLGYSQGQGLIVQTSVTQDNFLGSGKRISFAFNNSDYNRIFSVGYLNPYYTVDGISRGFNAKYSETNGIDLNITAFDNRVFGGGVSFGIPISENNSIFTSLDYENTTIMADGFFANEVLSFCQNEGGPGDCKFDVLRLSAGFAYDSRNKAIFPDWGMMHRVSAEVGAPSWGNSLEFYKMTYRAQWFRPIYRRIIFSLRGEAGYGNAYGNTDTYPFFENFYAGGPKSIRGFEENTLGPRDSSGNPLGGNVKFTGGAEVIFPVPFIEKADNVRLSAFLDAGNVYGIAEDVDLGKIRYSVGVGAIWMSPFGMVSVSLAKPYGVQPQDRTQQFQFSFGTQF
ncbi:MAG: outer membrane protein assembly factor BamA [Gammaproteobacteria bacterium RIFCSPLOWO2_02_FULL_56_15]|nr:MAG: outer membrane protein assembly factor BamA [Gammaproteobacteria bacterium RIFCSPLOWO2_02_FULL_56_15]